MHTVTREITERKRIEECHARTEHLAVVARLGLRAPDVDGLQPLFQDAAVLVARALYVALCEVLELLPGGGGLCLHAGVGWREGLVGHTIEHCGPRSQAGYTLLDREPVIADDVDAESRFAAANRHGRGGTWRCRRCPSAA